MAVELSKEVKERVLYCYTAQVICRLLFNVDTMKKKLVFLHEQGGLLIVIIDCQHLSG